LASKVVRSSTTAWMSGQAEKAGNAEEEYPQQVPSLRKLLDTISSCGLLRLAAGNPARLPLEGKKRAPLRVAVAGLLAFRAPYRERFTGPGIER
jgi:hypothetical protein